MDQTIDYDRYRAVAQAQRAEARTQLPVMIRSLVASITPRAALPLVTEAR